jgi:sulfur relay (sulfurtransferase) DsrF/TusC family protein
MFQAVKNEINNEINDILKLINDYTNNLNKYEIINTKKVTINEHFIEACRLSRLDVLENIKVIDSTKLRCLNKKICGKKSYASWRFYSSSSFLL